MADPRLSPAGPRQLELPGSKHRLSQLRPVSRLVDEAGPPRMLEVECELGSHLQAVSLSPCDPDGENEAQKRLGPDPRPQSLPLVNRLPDNLVSQGMQNRG